MVQNINTDQPDFIEAFRGLPKLRGLTFPTIGTFVFELGTLKRTHDRYRFPSKWQILVHERMELPPMHVAGTVALAFFKPIPALEVIDFQFKSNNIMNDAKKSVVARRNPDGTVKDFGWLHNAYCMCGEAWCCSKDLTREKWELSREGRIWQMYFGLVEWEDFGPGFGGLSATMT